MLGELLIGITYLCIHDMAVLFTYYYFWYFQFPFSFNHYLVDFDLADADVDLVSIRTFLSYNL